MVPITNSDSNLLGLRVRFSTLSSCSIARPNSPLNLPSVFHLGGLQRDQALGVLVDFHMSKRERSQ